MGGYVTAMDGAAANLPGAVADNFTAGDILPQELAEGNKSKYGQLQIYLKPRQCL